jgi:hypothetical protein
MLNKKDILGIKDAETRDVEVPEWKGSVRIVSLTKAKRDILMGLWAGPDSDTVKMNRVNDFLLVHCTVDEEGELLFVEADLPALKEKNGLAVDRLVKAATALNGFGKDAIEGAAKNSSGAPSASSASASLPSSAAPSQS